MRRSCVAHTAYNAHHSTSWYLDSGCSKHMTGDMYLFVSIEKCLVGLVTFGDGNKGKILGKGTVNIPGFSSLNDVLFVGGLKENLLSIGQFCDNSHEVHFSREHCTILNADGECVVRGVRSIDNCYCVDTMPMNVCNRILLDDVELWHQ